MVKNRIETPERKAALEWWNTLSFKDKVFKIKDKSRHPDTLTGYEIQSIYENVKRSQMNSSSNN